MIGASLGRRVAVACLTVLGAIFGSVFSYSVQLGALFFTVLHFKLFGVLYLLLAGDGRLIISCCCSLRLSFVRS